LSISDAGTLRTVAGFEGNLESSETLEVVPRFDGETRQSEFGSIPAQFDPAQSYGETRAAFDAAFERRYVSWLLERQHGNLSAAAREARMDRKHLHDLAKRHGLRVPKTTARP
jgi:DNA-binding NtrC family response regulator